ncbi:MAG TPA: hypothetical protein VF746_15300 [Longimicrobium sp.]
MTSRAFVCPACGAAELKIVASLELGADRMSDEITVQAVACSSCGLLAAAVYEESRRGSLDSDCWIHDGWRLPPERVAELLALIRGCPRPSDSGCRCPAHAALGARDETGRWVGLAGWAPGERFPLRWPE